MEKAYALMKTLHNLTMRVAFDQKLLRRKANIIYLLFSILILLCILGGLRRSIYVTEPAQRVIENTAVVFPNYNLNRANSTLLMRKLLLSTADYGEDPTEGSCSMSDIEIYQGPGTPLPDGIPTYSVQILNVCVSGCSICDIHVSCGWFSSARLINPDIFKRQAYDDCLVNGDDPLAAGESLSFQYANSFQYPLSISSVACC